MNWLSPALAKLALLRMRRIYSWVNSPQRKQREVLQNLVAGAQYTEFGKKYGLSKIFKVSDFKKAVPISEYQDLRPFIEREMNGEQNILWHHPINWFAKSSGTTSTKSKFIPISIDSLHKCHYKAARDVISLYYKNFSHCKNLLSGKGLVVGGSHQIHSFNEDCKYGDLSAILMQNSPFYGQWIRTPQLSIALMDDWESKLEKLAKSTINENVTSMSGVPTWTIILLKRILEITGKKNIKEVWPNLELYIHGGVSFKPYKNQFSEIIGAPINYINIYNASEGFFACQNEPDDDSMLLFTNHGIFYEFLPLEEYKKQNPQTVGLNNVVLNKPYALVITTNGGLWRYLIGDTVEFTSLKPYKINIVGRLKHFINAFGEELMVDDAEVALANTCAKMDCTISDFTAAPIYFSKTNNGSHEWLIEFDKEPPNIDIFTESLDFELKQVNSDYESKRFKDIALSKPIVSSIPKGSFNSWLKHNGKLGGQHKIPRLYNDRTYIDQIKIINHLSLAI